MVGTLNFAVGNRTAPLPKSNSCNISHNKVMAVFGQCCLGAFILASQNSPDVFYLIVGIIFMLALLSLTA
jgi:hypothetical protein